MRLPVIVGMGGINPAGRTSFHHGYRRLILDAISAKKQADTLASLAAVMRMQVDGALTKAQVDYILDHTLIRRIEPEWIDIDNIPMNKRMTLSGNAGQPLQFSTRAKDLPASLPAGWSVKELDEGMVQVTVAGSAAILAPDRRRSEVSAAGQLPSGFEPGKLYASRSHPRGLQMAIYAASDALHSTGLEQADIMSRLAPDEVSVYASSAMAQLDENGAGGLLQARLLGKRPTSKNLALSLAEMPADFINAYVLGNVGNTSGALGACATFLYNLRSGILDIKSGAARMVVVGGSDAGITHEVMEGYSSMGALATDEELLKLDADRNLTVPDYRRASRPFSTNCGFTLGEGAQYAVLMDDELALELGATIYGAVPDVFCNADGYKKSISSPGVGNYITVAKAVAAARAIVGENSVRNRSFIQAHGTSTPQNRTSESHILNETAKAFGIEKWPVAAIKSYLGHTVSAASGDQLMTSLGIWVEGIIPGIHSIDHVADDVFDSNLRLQPEHLDVGPAGMDVASLNAKGFGVNNASATVLSPQVTAKMLEKRHGAAMIKKHHAQNETVQARADAYNAAATAGSSEVIYRFDHNVLQGEDIGITGKAMSISGFANPIPLDFDSPYQGLIDGE